MSYQVLARKWRPRNFATLVGQEHVVRALTHALATGRLHHAYLFTGTRGVGKTTISRIFAKALNCETGVTAEPCGQCDACRAIDADRFPDYVEMDAASNRGVDDMAALLDKAAYAPVQGRYKVYMIDEVHMLTGHAFNAMLKTLEEPPAHIKFILATTDPQKIPVTVLSRCLQFNLKQMPESHIVEHLGRILEAEGLPFEPPALRQLAKAAAGSMRDALSLLDQAIAHGAGRVEEAAVRDMLGTVGSDHLFALLDALAAGDANQLIALADAMEARSLSFEAALQALAVLLTRIAVLGMAPQAIDDEDERSRLMPYVQAFDAETLQLAYQIVVHAREELALAPDEYTGFTMCLLRLLAFRPETPAPLGGPAPAAGPGGQGRARPLPVPPPAPAAPPPQVSRPAPSPVPPPALVEPPRPAPARMPPAGDEPPPPWETEPVRQMPPSDEPPAAPVGLAATVQAPQPSAPEPSAPRPAPLVAAGALPDWHALIRELGLSGLLRELAQHCAWLGMDDERVRLRLDPLHRSLREQRGLQERLQAALARHFGRPLRLELEIGDVDDTPARRDQAEKARRHAEAVAALERDPFVRELIERFDASLDVASVRAL